MFGLDLQPVSGGRPWEPLGTEDPSETGDVSVEGGLPSLGSALGPQQLGQRVGAQCGRVVQDQRGECGTCLADR